MRLSYFSYSSGCQVQKTGLVLVLSLWHSAFICPCQSPSLLLSSYILIYGLPFGPISHTHSFPSSRHIRHHSNMLVTQFSVLYVLVKHVLFWVHIDDTAVKIFCQFFTQNYAFKIFPCCVYIHPLLLKLLCILLVPTNPH